jgi:hypothetical protein
MLIIISQLFGVRTYFKEMQGENSYLVNERTQIHSKVEETLRTSRQSISMDFTKFLNEIEQLKSEKCMN